MIHDYYQFLAEIGLQLLNRLPLILTAIIVIWIAADDYNQYQR